MPKHIACDDLVAGCGFTAQAETEAALMEEVAEHAAEKHGLVEVTPEVAAKVKAAIHNR